MRGEDLNQGVGMTTTVTIKTVEGDKETSFMVNVTDVAQWHVLRSFNVTADPKVDATKVLAKPT